MKRLLFILAGFVVSACEEQQFSEELKETAVVEDVIFSPRQHGSGSGMGMTMKGTMVITSNDVTIPATYAVVFECQHGKFVIQGSKPKHKELWQKLKKGEQVIITYREKYMVDKDKNTRRLVKYDFLDAQPSQP